MSGDVTFRVAAVVGAALGALLLLSSWDGLYDTLDLPQAIPALPTQIGGLSLVALAFLLWSVPGSPELRRPVAIAGVIFNGGAAVLIASWLIFREQVDLGIGDSGNVELIVAAVVLAGLAGAMVRAGRA